MYEAYSVEYIRIYVSITIEFFLRLTQNMYMPCMCSKNLYKKTYVSMVNYETLAMQFHGETSIFVLVLASIEITVDSCIYIRIYILL